MNKLRSWIIIAGIAFIAMSVFFHKDGPKKGDLAPAWELTDLNGTVYSSESLADKKILLHFFATWCDVCMYEMRDFVSYVFANQSEDFLVFAISIDDLKAKNVLEKISLSYGSEFKILHDFNGSVADLYGVYSVPTNVIIENGVIQSITDGPQKW